MAEAWREVRVFVSSTFRDMQAERDHLVRFVFPRVRERLRRRRLHFVDVDLRWGVTSDQDAFDLCMREIDRCRPRFVCLLGDRYGWVPPPQRIPKAELDAIMLDRAGAVTDDQRISLQHLYVLDEEQGQYRLRPGPATAAEVAPWTDHGRRAVEALHSAGLGEGLESITASEVLHGALAKLDEPLFRFFYFRHPAVIASIPDRGARDYREAPRSFGARALDELKERIRSAEGLVPVAPGEVAKLPVPVYEYPCAWDEATGRIVDLGEFGDRVHDDLVASVDAEFGDAPPDPLDSFGEEDAAVDAFVETRLERYVLGSRGPVVEALSRHARSKAGNGYLCVVGAPGTGKSALLAWFYRNDAPRLRSEGTAVVPHFVGVNPTNVREVLRRLCHELAARRGEAEPLPQSFDELREAFPRLLRDGGRVVVVLDAIDRLDAAHEGPAMRWLPESLPENARLILSAVDGRAVEALRARCAPEEVVLPLLQPEESTEIVEAFLQRFSKELDAAQRAALLAKEDSSLPLYLVTALEELRTLGTYEELTDRIVRLPPRAQALFDWILERLEQDDGFRDATGRRTGADLVETYCTGIAFGRNGLAETELFELAASGGDGSSAAESLGNVAALQRLLRPYLMRRGELLDFFHNELRGAVVARYAASELARQRRHQVLARYFSSKGYDYARTVSELAHHLRAAGLWSGLSVLLTNQDFLERVASTLKKDLRSTGKTGSLIGPWLEETIASVPEAARANDPKLDAVLTNLTPLSAALELFFLRESGRLDERARCSRCGAASIIHGHVDLGGVDYYDNYFSWCTSCFWAWHAEDFSTDDSGLREFDYETCTYRW